MELDNLRTNVQRLTENIETASVGGLTIRQQLEYMSARLDRLETKANLPPLSRDVVAPVTPMMPAGPYPGPEVTAGPVAGGPVAVPPGTPVVPGEPEGVPGAVPGPAEAGVVAPVAPPAVRTVYDEGKDLYDQKNYQVAIDRFKSYLAQEPQGAQVPAAQFYIGESFYFQNKFEDAILEYQTLISGFPKNNLVSTALLKQGLSFQALGDKSSAKLIYQKVVREYPKSYSAGIARERLKTI
jgi:tol-pal system protein YbgF